MHNYDNFGRHNLKILGLISSDSGMFQCVGMNNAGSVQASAFLEVIPLGNFLLRFPFSQSFSVLYFRFNLEFNFLFSFIFFFSFSFLCFLLACTFIIISQCVMTQSKGSKKQHKNKKIAASTNPPKKPTKPDLKNIVKKSNSSRSTEDPLQKSRNLSKLALDSLLSRNKNSQFAPGKFPDTSDYVDRLNDNQQSESDDENYDDYDDEGSIHPISSGTDPNVLLHALTNSKKHHESFSDEVSHFSNPHINPVTRKNPNVEDSKHLSVPLPGPPRAVQAAIVKPRFVTLNWLEPEENPDEVVSYTVYYKMNSNEAR